jgi:hypothetical protein
MDDDILKQCKIPQKIARDRRGLKNRDLLLAAGLKFEERNDAQILLFRDPTGPKCNFYPTTGQWHAYREGKRPRLMSGGVYSFLNWYRRKRKEMKDAG